MKIKSDFVTNSSSSSFIISVDPKVKPKVVVEIDLEPYIDSVLKTKQEVGNWITKEYGYETLAEYFDESGRDEYDAMIEEIERGRYIYIGVVSSEGEGEENLLIENGLEGNNNFDVIHDCQGY